MDDSPTAVTTRLWPLLVAVHAAHGWNPAADRHLDHQLVRREAMERLRPWGADLDDGGSDPLLEHQLTLTDDSGAGLGLPMSGLILRTPHDVVRVWHSDDGELPAAETQGLRDFYAQAPTAQLRLQLALDAVPGDPGRREHLAQLWADSRAPGRDPELVRFDLVRPRGSSGRRVDVDWHVGLLDRLARRAA